MSLGRLARAFHQVGSLEERFPGRAEAAQADFGPKTGFVDEGC